jgi:hypothetical protein
MARKPNYQFERLERERLKNAKAAAKAAAKRAQDEQATTVDASGSTRNWVPAGWRGPGAIAKPAIRMRLAP